ncbi:hypothetical protein KSC_021170 [Ktedonobacter sp. SOSP1-52]|uniref:SDR family NAD(P)-dependent oxidoreductase n=1 Tax=Ktedonobacter sp. SOSP1-52 TaxID=2778366 RepID=UPI001A20A3E6|nr:SDR family oxidoreductase [Ktedonobacter sp. SOSP1-52]GHO63225.1 hypothetical protein KSC_021170 [Ktedonobacter sp. SOSP1-52]
MRLFYYIVQLFADRLAKLTIPFQDMTREELGGKLDDEMRAAFAVTKAVLLAMTEQGWGRIIYLGTGLSRHPRESMIALGMAKAALTQFARYLAQELGPRGITVNVVEPGPVEDTRMVGVLDEEYKQRQVAATPWGAWHTRATLPRKNSHSDRGSLTGQEPTFAQIPKQSLRLF